MKPLQVNNRGSFAILNLFFITYQYMLLYSYKLPLLAFIRVAGQERLLTLIEGRFKHFKSPKRVFSH